MRYKSITTAQMRKSISKEYSDIGHSDGRLTGLLRPIQPSAQRLTWPVVSHINCRAAFLCQHGILIKVSLLYFTPLFIIS